MAPSSRKGEYSQEVPGNTAAPSRRDWIASRRDTRSVEICKATCAVDAVARRSDQRKTEGFEVAFHEVGLEIA